MCFHFVPPHSALSKCKVAPRFKALLLFKNVICWGRGRGAFLSIQYVSSLNSRKRLFIYIYLKNPIRPIRFLCSALISLDLLHFLPQMENSREQSCFPLGPTSFRATYLPVSGCQTVSVYKTQAIYFVHIRVCLSSLFTRCLLFRC